MLEVGVDGVVVELNSNLLARIPRGELPDGAIPSVGDELEGVVLDSRHGRPPVLSVTMLEERLAWEEDPTSVDAAPKIGEQETSCSPGLQPGIQGPGTGLEPRQLRRFDIGSADQNTQGEARVSNATNHQLLDPVDFLQPDRRLFIDTNIFMDTDTRRAGGLKRLFERGQDAIVANRNPIVVPTKVVRELEKQSKLDPAAESPERGAAIKKAAAALTFLDSAARVDLVRKDLGDDTNPYADDLFLRLFERFASTYEMCLLTHDITLKLRIRLLAHRLSKRLVVGVLTKDGDLEVDSDAALFERGHRKYVRHAAHVADGSGNFKDESEVATLKPLLDDFQKAFGLAQPNLAVQRRVAKTSTSRRKTSPAAASKPFSATPRIKPRDSALPFTSVPARGDEVSWTSATKSGSFRLGALLGEGGEGSVYEGGRNTVVKIFDKDHITQHRKEKIELLVGRGLVVEGMCIPSAVVRNNAGEFVGYVMPKARGHEFQRAIFNKRKFEKEFPNWKKSDLVDVCISFLEKVQYLHSMNVILGDINPKNLMVDQKKNVFIIDADSWQVEGYPCPVGTPMFTSPSMLGKSYAEDLRTIEDDLFAIATMLFMIVMTGQFPYIRTGTDGDMVQLIKEGKFAFQISIRGKEYNDRNQPDGDWKYMWSHIHKPLKDLFWDTFHNEGRHYQKRPTATDWLQAFKAYKAYLSNAKVNFDPMSNEIRPIRSKAFRPDTPIVDCPQCGRNHAIAGIWHDDTQDYYVPSRCNKCRDIAPVRTAPARAVIVQCKDCSTSIAKDRAKYGRCPACAKKDDERQARSKTIDPSRKCTRCQQPFITYGNVEWHQREGKPVPTTHKAGYGGTYPAGCVPPSNPARGTTGKTSTSTINKTAKKKKKKGLWARLFGG
ncbi:hypothetical protein [Nocardioides sp. YIM 152588]|uniref:protein kinase domain-containing protein n=1 Tax=Nocardioides sp. YIM 152588 TaxID=3158259 RepID=UPI0032E4C365